MVAKTDFIPALSEQHTIHQSRNLSSLILRQPALKIVSDAGIALITFLAVFSGFPGPKPLINASPSVSVFAAMASYR